MVHHLSLSSNLSSSKPSIIDGKRTINICGTHVEPTIITGPIANPHNPHPNPNSTDPSHNLLSAEGEVSH